MILKSEKPTTIKDILIVILQYLLFSSGIFRTATFDPSFTAGEAEVCELQHGGTANARK